MQVVAVEWLKHIRSFYASKKQRPTVLIERYLVIQVSKPSTSLSIMGKAAKAKIKLTKQKVLNNIILTEI